MPTSLVTPWRMLEETIIMGVYRVKPRFLFLRDMTTELEDDKSHRAIPRISSLVRGIPKSIYCPLGVGGNRDHLLVRLSAIDFWKQCRTEPSLFFYEDLPYAARDTIEGYSVPDSIREIEKSVSALKPQYHPISEEGIRRKAKLCRAYTSQTDHGPLLAGYAKKLGKECASDFAEKYYLAE